MAEFKDGFGHRVFVMDRGGLRRITELNGMSLVRWSRRRDEISEARVELNAKESADLAHKLELIEPHRHELCIYRGEERVWEGPITLVGLSPEKVSINAKDICHYLERTVMRTADSSAGTRAEPVLRRLERVITRELSRAWEIADPPANILPYMVIHETAQDARTATSTSRFQMTLHQHLDQLAWRGGIDYTVVGRALHLLDVNSSLGQTRTVTDGDFTSAPIITMYGVEQASISIATDGQGNGGIANAPAATRAFYGPWELLANAYDESSGERPPSITELQSQAARNLAGRQRTPAVARIPDNSTIDLRGALRMSDLVPAVHVPLRVERFGRVITQMQKIQTVNFEETAEGETIKLTLYPAAQPDAVEV